MQLVRAGKLGGLFNVIGAENTTPVQRIAVTESRLKIPLLFGLDVIHGYRAIFPIPLAEAGAASRIVRIRMWRICDIGLRSLGRGWLMKSYGAKRDKRSPSAAGDCCGKLLSLTPFHRR
jgi:beta-glucosidase